MKRRPIVIGDTSRRLLLRAVDEKVRDDIHALCGSHQLNVTKGGYEVGIHAATAEMKKCLLNGICKLTSKTPIMQQNATSF